MQAALHFAIGVAGRTDMPRTLRILPAIGQPGSSEVRTSGQKRRFTANQHASMGKALAGILNSALDGVALLRAERNAAGRVIDFRWTRVNSEGERLLGWKADDLIGRT